MSFLKFFTKEKKQDLDKGLEKTREGFFSKITKAIAGKSSIDEEVLDEVENALIAADVGLETTIKIIDRLTARVAKEKYVGISDLNRLLKEEIAGLFRNDPNDSQENFENKKPYVIMVVGVNGVGKTTTIGKLAHQFKQQNKSVLLGAADTFRAAAIDQLTIWSERAGVDIIKQLPSSDPASVAFDTVQAAVARNADIAIIDTAGRLHNKVGLMNELTKIKRVMQKVIHDAPHEVLLVLDATTGQNAIEQAKQFAAATDVTGIVLTKLDGTAKGGVVLAIADQFKIPVRYIGVGEKMEQLQIFDKTEFADSFFLNQ
jgi:fused signal recognition particle receptor